MQVQEKKTKKQDQNNFTAVFKLRDNVKKDSKCFQKASIFYLYKEFTTGCNSILCWKGHNAFVSPGRDRR